MLIQGQFNMITIREYQTGDATKIFNLFSKHSTYQRDAAFWVWINRLLSDDKSIVVVAEIKGDIIGHYAILPRICKVHHNDLELKCGLGIHAFVVPEYRNLVSIFSISGLAYEIAESRNLSFIYGFPNSNYRLIQEKIERWKKVSLFKAFVKPITISENRKQEFGWTSISVDDFEKVFICNELLELNPLSDKISFLKSLPYFLNRYFKHPQNIYQTWLLTKGEETIGIIVTKVFKDTEVRVHIMDYVIKSNEYLSDMIDDFETKFSRIAGVSALWPNSKLFSDLLIQKGYSQTGFETFFGIKILNKTGMENQSILYDFNNWSLCMGDSDAF